MREKTVKKKNGESVELVEGEDFYFENGLMVLTARFLLKRGYCCDSGCRHCPYPATQTDRSE